MQVLNTLKHKLHNLTAESEWLKQAANDLEVDLDDDENADIAREGKQRRLKLNGLQRTLDARELDTVDRVGAPRAANAPGVASSAGGQSRVGGRTRA